MSLAQIVASGLINRKSNLLFVIGVTAIFYNSMTPFQTTQSSKPKNANGPPHGQAVRSSFIEIAYFSEAQKRLMRAQASSSASVEVA